MVIDKISEEKSVFYPGAFSSVRPDGLNKILDYATGKSVKVAMIDSGWDTSQADHRILKGVSFIDPEDELRLKYNSDYNDINGHGTACSDIILRVAPDVSIIPIKVFGKQIETSINVLEEAIKYAIDREVNIINLSLGTILKEAIYPIYRVCEIARQKKIIIVSAWSNTEEYSYPAIFENVISVSSGAVKNIFDFKFNKNDAIEFIAKGSFDDTLGFGGIRLRMSGNSFAAPVISGLIALIIEKYGVMDLDSVRKIFRKINHI